MISVTQKMVNEEHEFRNKMLQVLLGLRVTTGKILEVFQKEHFEKITINKDTLRLLTQDMLKYLKILDDELELDFSLEDIKNLVLDSKFSIDFDGGARPKYLNVVELFCDLDRSCRKLTELLEVAFFSGKYKRNELNKKIKDLLFYLLGLSHTFQF